jgi:hypothetical protein
MTKYIGGGYGAKQNEFVIDNPASSTGTTIFGGTSGELAIPSSFAVSGKNTTSAFRGQFIHVVVIHQIVDYLDYIGSNAADEPIGRVVPRPDIFRDMAAKRSLLRTLSNVSKMDSKSRMEEFFSPDSKDDGVVVPPPLKLSSATAAGNVPIGSTIERHFDEKERGETPKRSSSLTRPVLGSKR